MKSESSSGGKRMALRRLLTTLLLGICALYLTAWIYYRYKVHKAERLIEDVEQLKIGITSEKELRRFSIKHGGDFYPTAHREPLAANEVDASVWIFVLSPSLRLRGKNYNLPGLNQRQWSTQVMLDQRDGHLVKSFFGIAVRRSDGVQLEGFATVGNKQFLQYGYSYHAYDAHVTGPPAEFLGVEIGPDASDDEKHRGLSFNFGCLTSHEECRHVCEVMPGAWMDLPLDRRIHYPDGHELVVDAECRQALGASP
jgi:hypothetical protein